MANPPTSLIKPIFAVKHSLDKGYHLVATRDIKAGTLVLDEKPLIVLSQSFQNDNAWLVHTRIEMLLQKMNEKNVMDFHILYCSPDADTDTIHHNRFYKNCFNLENQFDGPEVPREDGCFKYASRINHACSPNTEATYYRALGRQKVYALKDIAAGDDFTVSYTNVLASRQSRQEDLETRYGFQCCCEACSLDTEESTDRDRRLQIVQRTLESVHSSLWNHLSANARLERLREIWEQMQSAGIISSISALPFALALDICKVGEPNGGLRSMVLWANLLADYERTLGPQHPETTQVRNQFDTDTNHALVEYFNWNGTTMLDLLPEHLSDWRWNKVELAWRFDDDDSFFLVLVDLARSSEIEGWIFRVEDGLRIRFMTKWIRSTDYYGVSTAKV